MAHLRLSICIATYNRAGYIGETLDSILPQLTEEVEVLVVDGASTDATETVLNAYTKKHDRIRYVRLPVKGGVDQDYDKAVELAQGEMCWLFTDDDLFKPGAVAAVIDAVKKGHDLIIVNAEVRNLELSAILQRQRNAGVNDTMYASDQMEDLFIDCAEYLTFIGSVVIRRSVWQKRVREAYFGTEFVHIGVIFQRPLERTAAFIAEPFISIRYGNAQWETRRFYIWMFKWPKLVWSFAGISSAAKLKISSQEPWRKLRTLLIARSDGEYTVQQYRQYLSPQHAGVLWKASAWCISLFPREIILAVRKLYGIVKKIHV